MRIAILLAAGMALPLSGALSGCGDAAAADPLTGTSWQLAGIESMAPDEQPSLTIGESSRYTVTFGNDGRASFQVDCNRGNSTWEAAPAAHDSGSLTFGPVALTRMMCPQPSDDARVAAALGQVRSFLLDDRGLHLSLEADSGIMHWTPLESSG